MNKKIFATLFVLQALIITSTYCISNDTFDQNDVVYQACGIASTTNFYNWAGNLNTKIPIAYPTNDTELAQTIKTAISNGCKIRPVGTTHSAAGLVIQNEDTNVVGISLAKYNPDDIDWDTVLDETQDIIRIGAGKTFLDLMYKVRPLNYFLPTQTAGFFFSIAGVISNTVHGGVYNRSFLHNYVTKLRVMNDQGEVRIIDSQDELKYWRNSFGMLGMITGVEFKLEKRNDFRMESLSFKLQQFNETSINQAMVESKANGAIYGEYFYNAYDDLIQTVTFYNNKGESQQKNCSWNYAKAECSPEAWCVYRFEMGDLTLDQSCRRWNEVSWSEHYDYLKYRFPQISLFGAYKAFIGFSPYDSKINELIEDLKYIDLRHSQDISKGLASSTIDLTEYLVYHGEQQAPDGYWIRAAPGANIMAYFFPADKLYQALDVYRTFVYSLFNGKDSIANKTDFKFNQPCEYRYVTLKKDSAVLQFPNVEGEYIVIEALHLQDGDDNYKWAFGKLEHQWSQIEGSFPHLGKIWGYTYDESEINKPEEFDENLASSFYSENAKQQFMSYQQKVDPNASFHGGYATKFLKPHTSIKNSKRSSFKKLIKSIKQ